ncbi:MAG TPA: hypothetical protein VFE23_05400 [Usitatibacter sp.]|jgi:hypothetical protein|nr:hypothetical protein [Usitatibacter sp.]
MKRAVIAAGLVLALAAAYFGYRAIDVLVVYAFEHYGPEILGVPVKVHGAHISVFDGTGRVDGIDIGNPAGYAARDAATVGEIRIALEPSSLKGSVVHVHELEVTHAAITYERGDGPANLDVIQRNIRAYVDAQGGGKAGTGSDKASGPKHRYIVDRLAIHDVKVTVTHPALRGQGITFDLPEVELRDVGAREGGVTGGEVANQVAATLEQKIAQKLLTRMDLLRQGGVQGAIDALRGLIRK